jgi:hypothetical protein
MDKETIKQLIVEFHESKLPETVEREIKIPTETGKIITIVGVRRSGKTYLMYSIIKSLENSGVPKSDILYISFDDPRLLPATAEDLDILLESYRELYPEKGSDGVTYLFLDEIQNVGNWQLGVRRLYDTRRYRIFLTGSSAEFLNKEIATSLRGRSVSYELMPFTFGELLAAKKVRLDGLLEYSGERFAAKKHLEDYFVTGGFPEVVLQDDETIRLRILKNYVETMFLRDLAERNKIKNSTVMRELFKFFVSNDSGIFSLNAFWKWFKNTYPVIKRTLIQYVSYLEDSGLIFLVRKFSLSLKEQNLRPRKVYIVDNGLRTVYGLKFGADKAKVLENSVFLALHNRKTKNPLMEIYYWKAGGDKEVDFLVKAGEKITELIQVCVDPQAFGARELEVLPLLEAMKEFKMKSALVITESYTGEEKTGAYKIIYKPFWKWILQQKK